MTVDRQRADAAYREWRKAVEAGLSEKAGRRPSLEEALCRKTPEGLSIEPLYVDAHADGLEAGWPGQPPFVRGASSSAGWLVCQRYDSRGLHEVSESVRRDVSGGATAVWLSFDRATRLGLGPEDPTFGDEVLREGVSLASADDLRAVVACRPKALMIDAGAAALPVAALTLAALNQERTDVGDFELFFGADPLGARAADGESGVSLGRAEREMAMLAWHCHEHLPHARAITISTLAHHEAGADGARELGYAAATLVEYLRALSNEGLAIDAAASQIALCFAVGRDAFEEIAKLRAARLLWSKVLTACGVAPVPAPFTMAVTSPRTLSRRDPHNNLIRGTAQTFAAIVGGVNAIATMPFDAALGEPDAFGRRMARNTQLVLGQESHLGQVVDAAGGSHYIERLTHELARAAWAHLQRIEQAGGMGRHVTTGHLGAELEEVWSERDWLLSRRKMAITGVSEFAAMDDEPLARTPRRSASRVDAAMAAASKQKRGWREAMASERRNPGVAGLISFSSRGASPWELRGLLGRGEASGGSTRLSRHREAEAFEALRDEVDALGRGDNRPAVLLVKLGPAAEHKAREAFAVGVLSAGGFRGVDAPREPADAVAAYREALAAVGTRIACICGADERYADEAASVAQALSAAGAEKILLAGRPGAHEEAWRDAGIARFIHLGVDVIDVLRDLLSVSIPSAARGGER